MSTRFASTATKFFAGSVPSFWKASRSASIDLRIDGQGWSMVARKFPPASIAAIASLDASTPVTLAAEPA